MPDGSSRIPRIRLPRITRPGRASRAAGEQTTATEPLTKPDQADEAGNNAESASKAPSTKDGAAVPAAAATATPETTKPGEGTTTAQPNLEERIEGLQGWMAVLERRQARITYFGGLMLLLALGAAGAALYFGLNAHSDSATKKDLDALTNRVNSLQGAVTKNSKDTQNALNASIAQLQRSIGNLQKQQAQASANISTLQSQVAAGALTKKAATPGATPTAPGATTTTTPNAGNGKNP
jgi:uncharacterized protein HemX